MKGIARASIKAVRARSTRGEQEGEKHRGQRQGGAVEEESETLDQRDLHEQVAGAEAGEEEERSRRAGGRWGGGSSSAPQESQGQEDEGNCQGQHQGREGEEHQIAAPAEGLPGLSEPSENARGLAPTEEVKEERSIVSSGLEIEIVVRDCRRRIA